MLVCCFPWNQEILFFLFAGHQHFTAVPHHQVHNFRKAAHILSTSIVLGQVQVLEPICLRSTAVLWRTQAPLDVTHVQDPCHRAHLRHLLHLGLWVLTVTLQYLCLQKHLWQHQVWVVPTTARASQSMWWMFPERITVLQARHTHRVLVKCSSAPVMSPYRTPPSFMIITTHSMLYTVFSRPVTLVVRLPFEITHF